MLVPAILYREALEKAFEKELYTESHFLYNGYAHCNTIPEISVEDNLYQFAMVDRKDKLVGYLSYRVDPSSDSVSQFGLYSFDRGNPLMGMDLFKEMERLCKVFRRIEWRMIGGNPVKKHYDKFCAKHNGNAVRLHDACRDADGNYRDLYIYEIVRGG